VDAAHGGELAILLGAEVRVGEGILDALDRTGGAAVCPLGGSRYVLLELSRFVPDPDPVALVHEVGVAGYWPVIAHVEQILWLAEDLPLLEHLVERGATLQVSAPSVLGANGRRTQRAALGALEAGLVHYLASDAHNLDTRPPGLSKARAAVAKRWGDAVGALLTEINPRAVIQDEPLPTPAST
jgi:protein-tyrosine phosphatase